MLGLNSIFGNKRQKFLYAHDKYDVSISAYPENPAQMKIMLHNKEKGDIELSRMIPYGTKSQKKFPEYTSYICDDRFPYLMHDLKEDGHGVWMVQNGKKRCGKGPNGEICPLVRFDEKTLKAWDPEGVAAYEASYENYMGVTHEELERRKAEHRRDLERIGEVSLSPADDFIKNFDPNDEKTTSIMDYFL